jgi:hypothetical protein
MNSAATTRTAALFDDAAARRHHVAEHDDLVRGHVWSCARGADLSQALAPSYHTAWIIRSSHTFYTACPSTRRDGQP